MRTRWTAFAALGLSACSTTTRPCSDAGDLTGLPSIKGNKQCYQRRAKDGRWLDHGQFLQWHPNGTVAIEGTFLDGAKTGVWTFYDEKGKKTAEKFYKDGVETTAAAEAAKQEKQETRR